MDQGICPTRNGAAFSRRAALRHIKSSGLAVSSRRMIDFYAILNAMYSDFSVVGQRYKLDTPKFYAYMAKAWLADPDAVKNNACMYYKCIADHG